MHSNQHINEIVFILIQAIFFSCSICDHLIDLNKRMLSDSQIAAQMKMKRTKCTNIFHKLGSFATRQLASKLKYCKYSIIIDETTDCSVLKSCAVIIKFFLAVLKMKLKLTCLI